MIAIKKKDERNISVKIKLTPVQYIHLLFHCQKEEKEISQVVERALNEYFDKRGEEI